MFAWWVSKVRRNRNIIITKVKSKYWGNKHKFGILFTNTVEEGLGVRTQMEP